MAQTGFHWIQCIGWSTPRFRCCCSGSLAPLRSRQDQFHGRSMGVELDLMSCKEVVGVEVMRTLIAYRIYAGSLRPKSGQVEVQSTTLSRYQLRQYHAEPSPELFVYNRWWFDYGNANHWKRAQELTDFRYLAFISVPMIGQAFIPPYLTKKMGNCYSNFFPRSAVCVLQEFTTVLKPSVSYRSSYSLFVCT